MVERPAQWNAYEYVVVASLRAHQLMGGCLPRLAGTHKATTMAQMEVSAGKVVSAARAVPANGQPALKP